MPSAVESDVSSFAILAFTSAIEIGLKRCNILVLNYGAGRKYKTVEVNLNDRLLI